MNTLSTLFYFPVPDRKKLSPSLLDKKRVRISHSTTTTSTTSTTAATTPTVSTNNSDRRDCDGCSLSPSLLERKSTGTSRCIRTVSTAPANNTSNINEDPTSPSLLASFFAVRRYRPYTK